MVNNSYRAVTTAFNDSLTEVISHSSDYLLDSGKNFSRNRLFHFRSALLTPFVFSKKSIEVSMVHIQDKLDVHVVPSAVTAARKKIKPDAFRQIFESFNRRTRRILTFKGCRIFAVDGSQIGIHGKSKSDTDPVDPYLARTKAGGKRRFIHLNALYDCLEKAYVSFIIQRGSEMNEDQALVEFARSLQIGLNMAIFAADRGYENQMTFYRLAQIGQYYLIRIKDKESSHAITKDFDLPEDPLFDRWFSVLLSSDHKVRLLQLYGEKRPIKYIANHAECEEFTEEVTKLPLNVRITRIKSVTFQDDQHPSKKGRKGILVFTSDNPYKAAEPFTLEGRELWTEQDLKTEGLRVVKEAYYTLASNLPMDEFSAADIACLYKMRWGVETSFRNLKKDIGLGAMHSRLPETIEQEVYASATVYNASSRIRNALEEERAARAEKRRRKKELRHGEKIQFKPRCLSLAFIIETLIFHIFPTARRLCGRLEEMCLSHTYQKDKDQPDTRH